jgi:dolichol-phosphate mannosyltransferase
MPLVETPLTGPMIVPPVAPIEPLELSLVVPTFNERANLADLLSALRGVLDAQPLSGYEVIVVDDDSPDATWQAAADARSIWPALRVVRRRGARGPAGAVVRGWQLARGAILGTINADLQHPPALLTRLLAALAEADVAVASRHAAGGDMDGWPMHRHAASALASGLGRALLPRVFERLSDPLSGFYLLRRDVIAGRELDPRGYKSLIMVLAQGRDATVRECAYTMQPRRHGASKLRAGDAVAFVAQLLRLRRQGRSAAAR